MAHHLQERGVRAHLAARNMRFKREPNGDYTVTHNRDDRYTLTTDCLDTAHIRGLRLATVYESTLQIGKHLGLRSYARA